MNQTIEVTKETAEALQANGVNVRYVISVADIAVNPVVTEEEKPRRPRAPRQHAPGDKFRIAKGSFTFQADSIAETALFHAKGLFSLNDRFTRPELTERLCDYFGERYSRQQVHSVVNYLIKHYAIIPAEGAIQRKQIAA